MVIAAVSGASGFVGQHVCSTLVANGCVVRAIVRDRSAAPAATTPCVVHGLSDRQTLRRAFERSDAVIHLAARVHVMGDRTADSAAAYEQVNVEGTRVLLQEAIAAGVRTFVFISSVKAVGESTATPWTEDAVPAPGDPYGRSKLEAERVVRTMADGAGIAAPILRLPLVYGPGMKANMLRLFQAVDRGWPLPLGSISNRRSLLYVGNLVAAIEAVASDPNAGRETFFVSDGQDLSTPELIREIGLALDRRVRLIAVPQALFRAAGRAGDGMARVLRWPVTTAALDRLFGSLVVDSSKLRQVTGFVPPFTVREGLRATAAWYKAQPR
jgi:nucleoside-diphosphate-sugar epimerase